MEKSYRKELLEVGGIYKKNYESFSCEGFCRIFVDFLLQEVPAICQVTDKSSNALKIPEALSVRNSHKEPFNKKFTQTTSCIKVYFDKI